MNDTKTRMDKDGIISIKYKLVDVQIEQLFTKVLVDYNQTEIILNNKLWFLKFLIYVNF